MSMLINEAIEILKEIRANCEFNQYDEQRDAVIMAIAALEKLEGKKPKDTKFAYGKLGDWGIKAGNCPVCGESVIGNTYGEYCGCCGQKLDWGEAYDTD